jgi:hypothetical protein
VWAEAERVRLTLTTREGEYSRFYFLFDAICEVIFGQVYFLPCRFRLVYSKGGQGNISKFFGTLDKKWFLRIYTFQTILRAFSPLLFLRPKRFCGMGLLSVCLSACLSVYISVCLSDCLSVYISVCLTVCPYIYLSVCLSVCPSVRLYVCLSVCLSVRLYVCLSVRPFICLSVCLSVCPPVCLSVCLSVCMSRFYCSTRKTICLEEIKETSRNANSQR